MHAASSTPAHASDQTSTRAASEVERLTSGSRARNDSASMNSFDSRSAA
jgi:hypothetical protein